MLINTTRANPVGEWMAVAKDQATGAALPLKPSHQHSIIHYISGVYATGNPQPDLAGECAA
jgi:hypothetical protein